MTITTKHVAALGLAAMLAAGCTAGTHHATAQPAACHAIRVHECITAPRDHARLTVPDDGVQPLCPATEAGWQVTFRLAGTPVTFTARCDLAGDVAVWDAR